MINPNITKKHNIIAGFEKLLSTFHFPTLNFYGTASNEEHQLRHFFWHCKHIRPLSGMVSVTSAGMIHLPQAAYQYPLHPFRLLSAITWMIFFFVIPYLFTWNPSIHLLIFSQQFFCCHSLASPHFPALFPHSIAGLTHFNAAFPHFDRVLTAFNMDSPHSDEVHPHFNRVSITFDRSPARQHGRMIPEMRPECD